jgi:hypothetical protein
MWESSRLMLTQNQVVGYCLPQNGVEELFSE